MALAALSLLGGRTTAQEPACKPPLMGWSSWNAYRVNISEDIIKHQADLMVEKGLKDAGYRFINIDDGFFGYRDETGKMHEHAQRFPNGMKVVVDHIHNLGLKAGIYTDAGNNTCGSMSDPSSVDFAWDLSWNHYWLDKWIVFTCCRKIWMALYSNKLRLFCIVFLFVFRKIWKYKTWKT